MQNAHYCEMQTQPTFAVKKITIVWSEKQKNEAFDNRVRPTIGPMCYVCRLSAISKDTVAVASPRWSWHQIFTAAKLLLNAPGV